LSVGADRPIRLGDELRVLARLHPRETWADHANLGQIAAFWLQRHAMFRQLDTVIREGSEAALDDWPGDAAFKSWLARHLSWLLGQLEEHHHVEDRYYFPVFRRAEPRLVAGFELLERDHAALHTTIGGIVEQANAVLGGERAADVRAALARFHDAQVVMGRDLIQHLDDEEDLVVPLLLERGERDLLGG
jgi:iron-sulfur cluster repair protein YtfE (RIC family)